jgi:hypothetical protein
MASTDLSSGGALRQAGAGRASHDAAKWSARKMLLFVGGASLTLWLVILLAATALLG